MDQKAKPKPTTPARRQFFAIGMRTIIIGGIGSYAMSQEVKRRRLAGDPNCIQLDTCTQCIELSSGCTKDKAENFRVENNITK
ncbi:MAG: hypothetical protein GXP30_00880 [Verrucomicrobia bacterium]|nr:hypothetical protein [Verrucomicrobiota bacterium]